MISNNYIELKHKKYINVINTLNNLHNHVFYVRKIIMVLKRNPLNYCYISFIRFNPDHNNIVIGY